MNSLTWRGKLKSTRAGMTVSSPRRKPRLWCPNDRRGPGKTRWKDSGTHSTLSISPRPNVDELRPCFGPLSIFRPSCHVSLDRSSVPVSKLPSHPCRTVKSCENAILARRHLMRCIKSWLRTIIFLVHFHRRCLEYLQLVYVVIGWVNRSQTARPHCHDWNFSFNDDDWWTH